MPRGFWQRWSIMALMILLLAGGCAVESREKPIDPAIKEMAVRMADNAEIQAAFARGREKALQNPEVREVLLEQNVTEQERLAENPKFRSRAAGALRLILQDPELKQALDEMIDAAIERALAESGPVTGSPEQTGR